MIVLRHGRKGKDHDPLMRGNCRSCGCLAECNISEALGRTRVGAFAKCPDCGGHLPIFEVLFSPGVGKVEDEKEDLQKALALVLAAALALRAAEQGK